MSLISPQRFHSLLIAPLLLPLLSFSGSPVHLTIHWNRGSTAARSITRRRNHRQACPISCMLL